MAKMCNVFCLTLNCFNVLTIIQGVDSCERIVSVLRRSCWLRKYVFLCTACGGLAVLLGALFLTVYFMLRSYTTSLNYFETVPTYVPAAMLIVTGLIVMCLAGRRNRYGYLIKLCGGCCLACAVLCVIVTITTTVIHMNRLQMLRECVYTRMTQTCTAASDNMHYVFNSTPDCEVIHGALYSCLRAIHEKKKMYWEQLEMRCRYLYRQQRNPHHCTCCDECRYPPHQLFPWEVMDDRYWTPGRVGNIYSPNPGEDTGGMTMGTQRLRGQERSTSGWSWRRLPWSRGSSTNNGPASDHSHRESSGSGMQNYRHATSSPDSQYGFSSHPTPAEGTAAVVSQPIEGSPSPYNIRDPHGAPIMTQPTGGFTGSRTIGPFYYMWGPPPPYSNPHSELNAMSGQVGLLKNMQRHRGMRRFQDQRRFDEFSSSSGDGVINVSDGDKSVIVENYVNTSEAEMATSVSKDRISNTLPVRKAKKRIDISSVKSVANIPFSSESQAGSQKSSPSHFSSANNANDHYHGNGHDDELSAEESHSALVRSKDGTPAANMSPRMRYMSHLQGVTNAAFQGQESLELQEQQGQMLCGKNEPTESEVYFADVSSCCNVSVRNDGQDSSLYDEALDPQKHRLMILSQGEELTSNCFSYQRQSSTRNRLPFPLPHHREFIDADSMRKISISNNGRAFVSPMSISTSSPGSFPTEELENCGSYYDNHNNSEVGSSGSTSAIHGDQHFLAPDAQYETIPQQQAQNPQAYQRHIHQQNFSPTQREDFNGNTPTNSPGKSNISSGRATNMAASLNIGGNTNVITSSNNNSIVESFDATMDSGCHSGSEFATRRRGGSARASARGGMNVFVEHVLLYMNPLVLELVSLLSFDKMRPRRVREEFIRNFPGQLPPSRSTIHNLMTKFETTGSVQNKKHNAKAYVSSATKLLKLKPYKLTEGTTFPAFSIRKRQHCMPELQYRQTYHSYLQLFSRLSIFHYAVTSKKFWSFTMNYNEQTTMPFYGRVIAAYGIWTIPDCNNILLETGLVSHSSNETKNNFSLLKCMRLQFQSLSPSSVASGQPVLCRFLVVFFFLLSVDRRTSGSGQNLRELM
ncbi:hypothetical protein L9F63_007447, partial [Diploptera punctata]